MNDSPSFTHE
jgi:hypothetical protein